MADLVGKTDSARHWWFWSDPELPEVRFWPEWLVWLHSASLRVRCLGLFHRFEQTERAPYDDDAWYCLRCPRPYEYDEEFVLGSVWSRLLFRISYRLYAWWHSWSWRFTER